MTDFRNELEKQLQDVIIEVMEFMEFSAHSKVSQVQYRDMMGLLRDMRVKLQNKASGCKSGKHSSFCQCLEGIERSRKRVA